MREIIYKVNNLAKFNLSIAVLLIVSIGICLSAGYIGSIYTTPEIPTWYAGLHKPDLSPPSWVFAPVWTALYILMGLSLFLIVRSSGKKSDIAVCLLLFGLQLVLNVLWPFVFFGLHSIFFGLLCIIALLGMLLCTIIQTFRISLSASLLLVPYLFWLCFATYLNYCLFILNPVGVSIF